MKKQLLLPTLFVLSVCFILTSCEKNNWLNSKSKATRNLENDWKLVLIPRCNDAGTPYPEQHWIYSEGKVKITIDSSGVAKQTDEGSYSLDVDLTDITLTLADLEEGVPAEALQHLNGKWTIVSIDEHGLVMAHQIEGSGLLEKEFSK